MEPLSKECGCRGSEEGGKKNETEEGLTFGADRKWEKKMMICMNYPHYHTHEPFAHDHENSIVLVLIVVIFVDIVIDRRYPLRYSNWQHE